MSAIRFDWYSAKAAANLRKHGVGFEEALVLTDDEHSVGEERLVLLGLSAALRVLVVVHCERREGNVIRIIPARKADRGERTDYAERRAP